MLKKSLLIAMLSLAFAPVILAQTTWTVFSPDTKEFSLLLPNTVQAHDIARSGMKFKAYHAQDTNGDNFALETGVYVDPNSPGAFSSLSSGVIAGMQDAAKERNLKLAVSGPKDCTGPGWTGKRYDLSMPPKVMGVLVALSNNKDAVFTIVANSQPETINKCLNSLKVDPALASKLNPDQAQDKASDKTQIKTPVKTP